MWHKHFQPNDAVDGKWLKLISPFYYCSITSSIKFGLVWFSFSLRLLHESKEKKSFDFLSFLEIVCCDFEIENHLYYMYVEIHILRASQISVWPIRISRWKCYASTKSWYCDVIQPLIFNQTGLFICIYKKKIIRYKNLMWTCTLNETIFRITAAVTSKHPHTHTWQKLKIQNLFNFTKNNFSFSSPEWLISNYLQLQKFFSPSIYCVCLKKWEMISRDYASGVFVWNEKWC